MIVADLHAAVALKRAGIKMPVACVRAARKAKLPLPEAAALLMMETGGGANVFGHDPTIFVGGPVTKKRYLAYKAERKRTGKMQGVGPTQLTYYGYQDEADRLGGCWKPDVNMRVGFSALRAHIRRYGIRRGFESYNGSGPAAVRYGLLAERLYKQFLAALAPAPKPKPKKIVVNPRGWWKRWVVGDTDCDRDLLVRLAMVARDYQRATGSKCHVSIRCGKRTYAEQLALYRLYLSGKGNLAAKPGTSNHETGRAADCQLVVNGVERNIGADLLSRRLLRKHGLCLPVAGETWHVEKGAAWRA